jgi:hypothetical protein
MYNFLHCGKIFLEETALRGLFAYYLAVCGWFVALRRKSLLIAYNTTEAFQDARNKRKKQETFSGSPVLVCR